MSEETLVVFSGDVEESVNGSPEYWKLTEIVVADCPYCQQINTATRDVMVPDHVYIPYIPASDYNYGGVGEYILHRPTIVCWHAGYFCEHLRSAHVTRVGVAGKNSAVLIGRFVSESDNENPF